MLAKHRTIPNVTIVYHGGRSARCPGVYPSRLATIRQVSAALQEAKEFASKFGRCWFEAPSLGIRTREFLADGSSRLHPVYE
jgi:hypothetical protein